ncbi:putative Nicotianamine synthase 3 [Calycina marina]|uniref:Nicotianamine synthase 3 n=1 Tax=Calycina marina TaxID=1763456 RepID=A0A9P8CAH1_9HELO|nr:putative Nicotianamine synthase 3 [Calycina marina]
MAPHAEPPLEGSQARDLESEVQVYVRKMIENVKGVKALLPIDTPEKADQVVPFWAGYYDIIAFTTLDIDLENALLESSGIRKLLPELRLVMEACEGAFETTWADRVVAARDSIEARKIFTTTPIHEFYEYVLKTEWAAILSVTGQTPESIAMLGSGAMPETTIWIADWAKEHGKRVRIHSLEILHERTEKSKKVLEILCGTEACTFETGDIKDAPKDLRKHDVVYFNATVGATTKEKEDILLSVVSRMRPGAFVLTRSTHSIKTMAYPPAKLQTKRIVEKLRPVLTTHLNGEPGRNANASFIISRVL